MATAAQITANQHNAQRSTGPNTTAGKARSSQNNLSHGFRSQSALLPGDDPAEYEALVEELTDHFCAADLTDHRLVREMADAEWRLRRVRRYQQTLLTRKIEELAPLHPDTDPIDLQAFAFDALLRESSSYTRFLRYETKFERQYNTAYNLWCAYRHGLDIKRRRDLETAFFAPVFTPPRQPQPAVLPDEPNPPAGSAPDTPRNAPCPCGSGLKFKRCCGHNAPAVLHAPVALDLPH
jgi:hypothetical protein